ncbi:hypothetical protein VST7929_01282 [Vibrio stylophorae]|uniref:Uncharacterized protein n=1 Tax=Vibrio stylophorae TaxID=659351 RepID=A0ABM8ZSW9_9VIBR|nr:hypothetical protein VST7929_01282 [Vibrio stylophorae]
MDGAYHFLSLALETLTHFHFYIGTLLNCLHLFEYYKAYPIDEGYAHRTYRKSRNCGFLIETHHWNSWTLKLRKTNPAALQDNAQLCRQWLGSEGQFQY